jgi:hypothetical protein
VNSFTVGDELGFFGWLGEAADVLPASSTRDPDGGSRSTITREATPARIAAPRTRVSQRT